MDASRKPPSPWDFDWRDFFSPLTPADDAPDWHEEHDARADARQARAEERARIREEF